MSASTPTSSYLQAIAERVVIFDGAMGTNLQLAGLTPDDFGGPELEGCNELLVVSRPEVVDRVHRSFFEVGCDVVETDTFGAFAPVLAEYGQAHRVRELNLAAVAIARGAADDFSTPGRPRWVAGSIGPGTKFPTLGQIRYADLRDAYEEQAAALVEGGADLIVIETVFVLDLRSPCRRGRRRE
ncbi:MAG: homocysteine S-methyltransferase family protein [Acidimicrobiales bacterium]